MASEEPAYARAAWEIFYLRHVKYLFAVAQRAYARLLGGDEGVADLVAETFQTAYEKAHTFRADGINDEARQRLRVRGWLGWIAKRKVQDLLRGRGQVRLQDLEMEQWQKMSHTNQNRGGPNKGERLVREALATLSEREQMVIRVTFQWYQVDQEHQRLPNDLYSRDYAIQYQR